MNRITSSDEIYDENDEEEEEAFVIYFHWFRYDFSSEIAFIKVNLFIWIASFVIDDDNHLMT